MKRPSVRDWPITERPVEKAKDDISKLSDAELLSIVLRVSTYEKDEVAFARDLLARFGNLRGVFNALRNNLQNILKPRAITELAAIRELSVRLLRENMLGKNFVRSPQAIMDYLIASMRDLKREVFKVLFLDKALRITSDKDLFEGTVDEAAVHPREIVKTLVETGSSNIVLVHNHPSGKTEPSREDHEITQKIKAACQTIGARVLDHVIIGENQYFSFSERGLI